MTLTSTSLMARGGASAAPPPSSTFPNVPLNMLQMAKKTHNCMGKRGVGTGALSCQYERYAPGVDEGGLPLLVRVQVRHTQRPQVLRRDRRVDEVGHVGHRFMAAYGEFHEEIGDAEDNVGDVVRLGVLQGPELVQALHILLDDVVRGPGGELHPCVRVVVVVVVVDVALLRLLFLARVRVRAVFLLRSGNGWRRLDVSRDEATRRRRLYTSVRALPWRSAFAA